MARSSVFRNYKAKRGREKYDISIDLLPTKYSLLKFELYNRLQLFPWWIKYHKGLTYDAILKNEIIELGITLGLERKWLKAILRHTISEFSKKGLGTNYYGYHNIEHELEAVYFTLVAIKGINSNGVFLIDRFDILYLFVSALFHDYDPFKEFDKPNEDSVEYFIRNDSKIKDYIASIKLDINIVLALIHRTAYPFTGEIAIYAKKRIHESLTNAGIPENDFSTRAKYEQLGWFLSVAERMAGYAIGNSEHAKDMARRNAHALGWHPCIINKNSVKYFNHLMNTEKEMFELIINNIPEQYRKNFFNNVTYFEKAWKNELILKDLKKGTKLKFVIEKSLDNISKEMEESLLNIYNRVPTLIRIDTDSFRKTLGNPNSILVTLRINETTGKIIGYAKGGPLENYTLRPGTVDTNMGLMNTIYLEGVSILEGYWGESCGHFLRIKFLNESLKKGFTYVTGYTHRDVIEERRKKLEYIEIIKKYDPDKLDYYRIDLQKSIYQSLVTDAYDITC